MSQMLFENISDIQRSIENQQVIIMTIFLSQSSHACALIIDPISKSVCYFDPHGNTDVAFKEKYMLAENVVSVLTQYILRGTSFEQSFENEEWSLAVIRHSLGQSLIQIQDQGWCQSVCRLVL